MSIPSDNGPILDKPEGNAASFAVAVLIATLSFILFFALQVFLSGQKLNILIFGNKALASSAFFLIGVFAVGETVSRYKKISQRYISTIRGVGVMGFIYAFLHILFVLFVLKDDFSREWLVGQNPSILFAEIAAALLLLLFAGFTRIVSKKLGTKKPLYIQVLSYLAVIAIFIHTFLLYTPSYYSAGQALLGTVRPLELVFIGGFLVLTALICSLCFILNKRLSLRIKIVAHTSLFFAASAITIVTYISVADTERHHEETFYSNLHIAEYMKKEVENKSLENTYPLADSLTETSKRQTIVYFLNSDKRIAHHPEKREEDTPYQAFGEKEKDKNDYGWNIAYQKDKHLFLDTVVALGQQQGYLVVSTDYTGDMIGSGRQIIYSSVLIIIIISITGVMTLIFSKKNILGPIKKITGASKKIAEGDLSAKIEVKSNDEFATLAEVFNTIAQTLQKQINDLVKTDKLKNEFIAIASHNLRTPLTTLRGYLDMLGMEKSGKLSKRQKDLLQKADRSATVLTSLTEGLVNITSLETQGVKIEKGTVDLTAVISGVVEGVSSQAKAKEIKIENKFGNEAIITIGDEKKLKQAFLAVLENAVKFNKKGGKITLEKIEDDTKQTTVGRKEIIITVKDTGIGISKNEKENVFQKFNRGTSTYTYEYEGVGLGLYIAKLIIQAHHGRIWFESAEGKGTTFYISLTTTEQNVQKGRGAS